MNWYLVCCAPKKTASITSFPCHIGRDLKGRGTVKLEAPSIAQAQFTLTSSFGRIYYINDSPTSPARVDGRVVPTKVRLTEGIHIIQVGNILIGVGTNYKQLWQVVFTRQIEPYVSRPPKPSPFVWLNKKRTWLIGGIIAAVLCIAVGWMLLTHKSSDDVGFNTAKSRIVLVHTKEGKGTGFLIKMNGKKYVLTNEHVIRSVNLPDMELLDGTKLELGALSVADDRDLARFEVNYDGDCFELEDALPNNEDKIWIYGNSLGDDVITTITGRVTGVGSKFVKVDAEFVPGNSGCPILNEKGKVIAVASYLRQERPNWATKNTQFESVVRRFGVREAQINWIPMDKNKYVQECNQFHQFKTYYNFFYPYLAIDMCPDKTLRLKYMDFFRNNFAPGNVGDKFHEILMSLSRSYNGYNEFKEKLTFAATKLTPEEAEVAFQEIVNELEDVKDISYEFIANREEALNLAQDFLLASDWENPLILKGYCYNGETDMDSVIGYRAIIEVLHGLNKQREKEFQKAFQNFEKNAHLD